MDQDKFKKIIQKEDEVISQLNDTSKLRERIRNNKEKHNKEVRENERTPQKKIASAAPEVNI